MKRPLAFVLQAGCSPTLRSRGSRLKMRHVDPNSTLNSNSVPSPSNAQKLKTETNGDYEETKASSGGTGSTHGQEKKTKGSEWSGGGVLKT